jgi:hypothetical protein
MSLCCDAVADLWLLAQICFLGPAQFSTFGLIRNRLFVSPVIETFVYSKVRRSSPGHGRACLATVGPV